MISVDDARMVAVGATVLAGGIGVALTSAIAGAMVEAVLPGVQDRMGSRVWAWLRSALSVALRAFLLFMMGALAFLTLAFTLGVSLLTLVKGVFVTYLHTYQADKGTGRHYPGMGHFRQAPGRHRAFA